MNYFVTIFWKRATFC